MLQLIGRHVLFYWCAQNGINGSCRHGIVVGGPEQPLRAQPKALTAIGDPGSGDADSSSREDSPNLRSGSGHYERFKTKIWDSQSSTTTQILGLFFLSSLELPLQHKSHQAASFLLFGLGVRASERLAEIDMPYLLKYQPTMQTIGQKYCVDPAVIAGILSRKSPGDKILVNVGDRTSMVQVTLHLLTHVVILLCGTTALFFG